ncbi:MAG: glucans biosynthesis glucosyltransferase MdoH, partial [Beijerinckiaceae bacterium]
MAVSMDQLMRGALPAPLARPQLEEPALPPEDRLSMPVQSFDVWSVKDCYKWQEPERFRTPWFSRTVVFGGGLLITAYGANEIYQVVKVGGTTLLEWVLLTLFLLNFSWIALAFSSGVVGFASLMRRKRTGIVGEKRLKDKTAVVMPIYNEAPSRVFGAMAAMIEDIRATGQIAHFEFFFLSDTTDPDMWVAEERALFALRERLPDDVHVYYRHRLKNTARKAGNIQDFVTRWGGRYAHMLVLDADSLMTGEI